MRAHPPERLRELLAERRCEGEAFAIAWLPAVAQALAETASSPEWRIALMATRDAWRRAYDGQGDGLDLTMPDDHRDEPRHQTLS